MRPKPRRPQNNKSGRRPPGNERGNNNAGNAAVFADHDPRHRAEEPHRGAADAPIFRREGLSDRLASDEFRQVRRRRRRARRRRVRQRSSGAAAARSATSASGTTLSSSRSAGSSNSSSSRIRSRAFSSAIPAARRVRRGPGKATGHCNERPRSRIGTPGRRWRRARLPIARSGRCRRRWNTMK